MQELKAAGCPVFNHAGLCESVFEVLINKTVTLDVTDIMYSPFDNFLPFALSFQNRMFYALTSLDCDHAQRLQLYICHKLNPMPQPLIQESMHNPAQNKAASANKILSEKLNQDQINTSRSGR